MQKQQDSSTVEGLVIVGLGNLQLQGANLGVPPGVCMALSGPSGCGKSLLLRSIADLDLHEGEVFLNGENCRQIPAPAWRRRVMLVPAECQWWYETVAEHFPGDTEVDLGALGFEKDVMGWEVERLSTGEKQRLGLLRALAYRPKALLLDEPTSALDTENRLAVERLVADFRQEQSAPVIWVSHDREQVERTSSRRMTISSGRLCELE